MLAAYAIDMGISMQLGNSPNLCTQPRVVFSQLFAITTLTQCLDSTVDVQQGWHGLRIRFGFVRLFAKECAAKKASLQTMSISDPDQIWADSCMPPGMHVMCSSAMATALTATDQKSQWQDFAAELRVDGLLEHSFFPAGAGTQRGNPPFVDTIVSFSFIPVCIGKKVELGSQIRLPIFSGGNTQLS